MRGTSGQACVLPKFTSARCGSLNPTVMKKGLPAWPRMNSPVARLMADHGESKVVALVLLLAYANFQDRLLLALGVPIEPAGPMPPPDVRFDPLGRVEALPPALLRC